MHTENEIKALPLEEQQKLVIDLKTVPAGDKYYETAQRLIKFTESIKGYKAPATIEVKNVAGHDLIVDGQQIGKDATVRLLPWQFRGLARFFEEAGKAATLLLFLVLLLFGSAAQAQVQTYLVGSPSTYNVVTVGPYGGGVANVIVTTNLLTPVTNVVSIITNANWTIVGGVATNQVTTTTNTTVNQPGIVSIANYDGATLMYSGAMMAGSTNVNSNVTVDYSPDMVNWQTNKWTLPITMAGTSQGTTNLDLSFNYGGFIRFNTITMAANVPETNVFLEVSKKPYRTGP